MDYGINKLDYMLLLYSWLGRQWDVSKHLKYACVRACI
jgi:hypothetical protein